MFSTIAAKFDKDSIVKAPDLDADVVTSLEVCCGSHNPMTLLRRASWTIVAEQLRVHRVAASGMQECRNRTNGISAVELEKENGSYFVAFSAADAKGQYGCCLFLYSKIP